MPFVPTLDRLADAVPAIQGIWAHEVRPGDEVVFHTRNSQYRLVVIGNGRYYASGGWFNAAGATREPLGVAGCTFGGCAIVTGLVAAPGLFVEFDNGVCTTRVKEVQLIRADRSTVH